MVLKYYFDLMSQPCRALYMFLHKTNIPYQPVSVALRKAEHFTEDFAKVNPFQKVPVIDHDGFVLTESVAILRYLSDQYNVADHWYPKDTKQRARLEEYLNWQHLNIRAFGSMVFRTKFIELRLSGEPVDEKALASYKKNLGKILDQMDKIWLKDRKYLCGDKISVADLLGVCEIEQPITTGVDVYDGRPNLKAWMARVRDDMNPLYDESHKFIHKLRDVELKSKM